MDDKEMRESLHPYERQVLRILRDNDAVEDAAGRAGMQSIEVMRAFQWLQNKGIVTLHEELREEVTLGENGLLYQREGLPEKRVLAILTQEPMPVSKVLEKAHVSMEEVTAILGILKRHNAVSITKKDEVCFALTEHGAKLRGIGFPEEKFLAQEFPINLKDIAAADRPMLELLQKRKDIVRVELIKRKRAVLTPTGKRLAKGDLTAIDTVDKVTSDLLISKKWKDKTFRRYDVASNVPRLFAGKKHHYRRFLDDVRTKFLSMGFTEMEGPLVETNFWNMDALFMPQFHSARDIHDAYYVKEPKYGTLDPKIVEKVKGAHENGFGTGSKGWQYPFDIQFTHRLLLRTQGTAVSARMLGSGNIQIPGKYFGLTRVFRADVIDATHNVDFYQTEGIIIEEHLTLRHLFGLLRLFAREFANTEEIRLVPGYFPFTEPSCELYAKHPDLGWVELGGAGIFRPEVVKPLMGKEISVLAWGLGIDRLGMFKLGIKDIRSLFSHDLQFLRDARMG
ncbi:phenylalanine--tRNA ligase subunit alpha [Candidatus Woesearchaeota archaeon]|nr:phenylalanine--tRNA ligase subunit alpha [Candidatus Woesearchaeota archaeon]